MKATLILAAAGIVLCAARGDDGDRDKKPKVPADIKALLDRNLKAMAEEDLDELKATLHPDCPGRAQNVTMTRQLFASHDLAYTLLSSKLVGTDADYAFVRYSQETRKKAGGAFRDNRLDGLHVLRRDGKKWKLWTTAILEFEFLD